GARVPPPERRPGGRPRGRRRGPIPAGRRGGEGRARPGPGAGRRAVPRRQRRNRIPGSDTWRGARGGLALRWRRAAHASHAPALGRRRGPCRLAAFAHRGRAPVAALHGSRHPPPHAGLAGAPPADPPGGPGMTCAPESATFRLLDATVGWDEFEVRDLIGFTDPAGIRLAHSGPSPQGPTRGQLLPWFPDRRLAPGCQPCAWYLIAGTRLLRRD